MRTMLFRSFDPNINENSQFLRDLKIFLNFSSEEQTSLVKMTLELVNSLGEQQRNNIIEKFTKETQIQHPNVISALKNCTFLVSELANDNCKNDEPDDLGEDLRELAGLTREETKKFIQVVTYLKREVVPEYKVLREKKAYEAGVLPSFRSCGATVEFRAVLENRFKFGMALDKYKPKITGHVPVISVHFSTDSGFVHDFAFQASPKELALLIDRLQAALIEAEAFQKQLTKFIRK